jgi:hypothetical protein
LTKRLTSRVCADCSQDGVVTTLPGRASVWLTDGGCGRADASAEGVENDGDDAAAIDATVGLQIVWTAQPASVATLQASTMTTSTVVPLDSGGNRSPRTAVSAATAAAVVSGVMLDDGFDATGHTHSAISFQREPADVPDATADPGGVNDTDDVDDAMATQEDEAPASAVVPANYGGGGSSMAPASLPLLPTASSLIVQLPPPLPVISKSTAATNPMPAAAAFAEQPLRLAIGESMLHRRRSRALLRLLAPRNRGRPASL